MFGIQGKKTKYERFMKKQKVDLFTIQKKAEDNKKEMALFERLLNKEITLFEYLGVKDA